METIRCPLCGATHRMLGERHDGSLRCFQCGCTFRIDGWRPKLSVRDLRPPRYFSPRTRAFIDLMRPFTLLAAGLAGFFLVLLFSTHWGEPFSIAKAIACGISFALLQSGGQTLNQSLEEEIAIDRASGKVYRPTVQGLITPAEGRLFSSLLFISGISLAFHLGTYFGFFSIVVMFFAVFYTLPPLRVKRRFLLNNAWQGFARGALPVLVVAYGLFSPQSYLPACYATVVALWMTWGQAAKDFGDEPGDREFGIRTLPVVLGRERAIQVMAAGMASAFAMLAVFVWAGALPSQFLALLALAVPSWLICLSLHRGYTVRLLENNLGWGVMYATLGLWYVLPALMGIWK